MCVGVGTWAEVGESREQRERRDDETTMRAEGREQKEEGGGGVGWDVGRGGCMGGGRRGDEGEACLRRVYTHNTQGHPRRRTDPESR